MQAKGATYRADVAAVCFLYRFVSAAAVRVPLPALTRLEAENLFLRRELALYQERGA